MEAVKIANRTEGVMDGLIIEFGTTQYQAFGMENGHFSDGE